MTRFILGGLSFLLIGLLTQTPAEEIKWRPTGTSTSAKDRGSPVFLKKPVTNEPGSLPQLDESVKPATYTGPITSTALQLRQYSDQNVSTEPVFPGAKNSVTTQSDQKSEEITAPRIENGNPSPVNPQIHDAPVYRHPPVVEPDWSSYQQNRPLGRRNSRHGWALPFAGSGIGEFCGKCVDDCCGALGCFDNWGGAGCCDQARLWVQAEYLHWNISDGYLPPLVTTTTLSNAQLMLLGNTVRPGALGQPGTVVLFGGEEEDTPSMSGGRFTIGFSGPCHRGGIEATYFFLSEENRTFGASSTGTPGLFRPFFDVNPAIAGNPAPNSQLVALGSLSGSVVVDNPSRLWGLELNLRKPLRCECNWKLDVLCGIRFLELDEHLQISEDLTFNKALQVPPGSGNLIRAGDRILLTDFFGTENRYYGGQIGLDFEKRKGRWIFGATGKLGIGLVNHRVNINGATVFMPVGAASVPAPGGLLAQRSNIGRYARDEFAFVPEIGLRIGYQLTDHLSVYVGYNALYMSNVVRPGDQIDPVVNSSQLARLAGGAVVPGNANPNPFRPIHIFRGTGFLAHGLNGGLKLKY